MWGRRRFRPGEYRANDRELYRIEELHGSRAFIENCRTGELLDVELAELDGLRPVRAAEGSATRFPAPAPRAAEARR